MAAFGLITTTNAQEISVGFQPGKLPLEVGVTLNSQGRLEVNVKLKGKIETKIGVFSYNFNPKMSNKRFLSVYYQGKVAVYELETREFSIVIPTRAVLSYRDGNIDVKIPDNTQPNQVSRQIPICNLRVGIRVDNTALARLNPNPTGLNDLYTGFEPEIMKNIFPDCSLIFVPVQTPLREQYLLDGRVDVIASTMSATSDRARRIRFTTAYYQTSQRALARSGSGISWMCDSQVRTIAVISKTTAEDNVKQVVSRSCQNGNSPNIKTFDSHEVAVSAVQNGEADIFVSDDIILKAYAKSRPNLELVLNSFSRPEYIALATRLNDSQLNQYLRNNMARIYTSGLLNRLSLFWLGTALPDLSRAAFVDYAPPYQPPTFQAEYNVQYGDWLSTITSRFYGTTSQCAWRVLYNFANNASIIGQNPDLIAPGMRLRLPSYQQLRNSCP